MVTQKKRQKIFLRDGRSCIYCRAKKRLTIDHIQPRSQGGNNDDSNLQTLCRSCNQAKGNRWPL